MLKRFTNAFKNRKIFYESCDEWLAMLAMLAMQ
jgi:hypothetical protein